jgi:hypothetical protein
MTQRMRELPGKSLTTNLLWNYQKLQTNAGCPLRAKNRNYHIATKGSLIKAGNELT